MPPPRSSHRWMADIWVDYEPTGSVFCLYYFTDLIRKLIFFLPTAKNHPVGLVV